MLCAENCGVVSLPPVAGSHQDVPPAGCYVINGSLCSGSRSLSFSLSFSCARARARARACVCVCVRERERERER